MSRWFWIETVVLEHFESAWLCPSLFKLEIDRLSDSLNQSHPGIKFILIIDDNRLMKTSLDSNFENLEVIFLQTSIGEKELASKVYFSDGQILTSEMTFVWPWKAIPKGNETSYIME